MRIGRIAGFGHRFLARAQQPFSSIDPLNISPRETSITSDDLLINLSELRVFLDTASRTKVKCVFKKDTGKPHHISPFGQPVLAAYHHGHPSLPNPSRISLWPGGPKGLPVPAEHCCRHRKVPVPGWVKLARMYGIGL